MYVLVPGTACKSLEMKRIGTACKSLEMKRIVEKFECIYN